MSIQKMKCSGEILERIVTDYGGRILRLCELYLGDHQLAEDAVQETFVSVYEKYGTFEGKSSEYTWITRIAINQCKNIMRKRYFQMEQSGYQCETSVPDSESSDGIDLEEELQTLPKKEREALLLYYFQDMETKEIAARCQISEAAVRQRLKRGRERMREALGKGVDTSCKSSD